MKTAKVNVKDVLGKLGFLKNNLSLLLPIFIIVVAVLLFIPTRLLRGRLQATIQKQSLDTGRRIDSLIREVNQASEAEAMARYIDAYAQDANRIELLMKQTTQRELLSYDLFPDTNDSFLLLFEEFGHKYVSGVEAMLQSMGAGGPPTDVELQAALKNAPRSPYQPGGGYGSLYGRGGPSPMMPPMGPGTPGAGSGRMMFGMMTETDRKIIDKVCLDKASMARVYTSPIDWDGFTFWNDWKYEDSDSAYRACWYWQLGYWILEDVAASVGEINQNAPSILTAPVKRVMNVSFTLQRAKAGMMRSGSFRPRGRRSTDKNKQLPAYVFSAKDASAMTVPCTGRYTCRDFDVVHFNVRVIIRSDQVLPFLQTLCRAKEHKFRGFYGKEPEQTFKHNQITVLETKLSPINPLNLEHQAYRYGDDAVEEMDIICEYLFYGKAYDEIMPGLIRDDINNAGKAPGKK
jgi:hypothetical protein